MICPNCQVEQVVGEQNFGALYTCGSCQAVYFVNFDGQPEFSNSDLPELGSIEPQIPENKLNSDINYQNETNSNLVSDQVNVDNPFEGQNNLSGLNMDLPSLPSNLPNFENNLGGGNTIPGDVVNSQLETLSGAGMDIVPPAFQSNFENTVAETPPLKSGDFAKVAKEISEFGNVDTSVSGLSYDLQISGIDTQETRSLFHEAIEDSKFSWDAAEIMRSIRNGRVTIKKISPAKAYILSKRIQFLDIEKKWTQNVLA